MSFQVCIFQRLSQNLEQHLWNNIQIYIRVDWLKGQFKTFQYDWNVCWQWRAILCLKLCKCKFPKLSGRRTVIIKFNETCRMFYFILKNVRFPQPTFYKHIFIIMVNVHNYCNPCKFSVLKSIGLNKNTKKSITTKR